MQLLSTHTLSCHSIAGGFSSPLLACIFWRCACSVPVLFVCTQ